MPNIRKSFPLILCLILFLAPGLLSAQKSDSLIIRNDSFNVFMISEEDFNVKNFENHFQKIDTSLKGFQENEHLYHDHVFYAKPSSPGHAERCLIFDAGYDFDQISSHKYFSHFFQRTNNAKYYKALYPYANAFYMMGPKREQLFDFLFTRNFGPLLNMSADYYLIYTPGIYSNEKVNNNFVSVTSNFHSKNKKYVAIADYFYNRMRINESGGITNDSVFTQNELTNRELFDVNITNAENRVKESGIYFKQYYFPGFATHKNDTVSGNEKYHAFGRIAYSLQFRNLKEAYHDWNPKEGFYQNIFLDSAETHDSLQVNFIENKIEWSNLRYNTSDSTEQHIVFKIAAKHLKQHLYGIWAVSDVNSIIPEASCAFSLAPLQINFSGFLFAGGYNKGDFSVNADASYTINRATNKSVVNIGVQSVSQAPSWYDLNYFSNHFQWMNDFTNENVQNVYLKYSCESFSSEVSLYRISDPVYYDTTAFPVQLDGSCSLLKIRVAKTFKWKKWRLKNDVVFQKSSGTDVIRLPELCTSHSLYYSGNLIRNVLSAEMGTDISLFSSYYPLAYMPATRQFYLQNDYKSSIYPYVDFFVNLKIKRMRIFLKLDHANAGLLGYDYFLIPHYPMSDRAFKFGLSWTFYN